jgi:O-antigen/teichoic acid export membrane protein
MSEAVEVSPIPVPAVADVKEPSAKFGPERALGLPQQFAQTFAVATARIILSAVTGVVLARVLGPGGRGEYAFILLWCSTLSVLVVLGGNDALSYCTTARPEAIGPYLKGSARLTLKIMIAGLPVALMAVYFLLRDLSPLAKSCGLVVALMCIPLAAAYSLAQGFLQGLKRFRSLNGLLLSNDIAYCILMLAAAALAHWFGHSFLLAAAAFVGAAAFTAANSARLVLGEYLRSRPFDSISKDEVRRDLWRYGVSVAPGNWIALFGTRMDEILTAQFLPTRALGIYVVAKTAMVGINAVPQSLSLVLLPRIVIANQSGNVLALFFRVMLIAFAGCLLICGISYLAIPLLLPILFGEEFGEAIKIAQILVLSAVLAGMTEIGITTLKGMGRLRRTLLYRSLVAALIGVFFLLLAPSYGLVGAAAACAAANAIGVCVVFLGVCVAATGRSRRWVRP